MTTSMDGEIDVKYLRHCAYEAFMKGDMRRLKQYIRQAIMLEDTVVIYRCVRLGDEPG